MAAGEISSIVQLAPWLVALPYDRLWSSYDREADVLYLTFKRPSRADDSELTDDDLIIRYEGDEIVGITILHASRRGLRR